MTFQQKEQKKFLSDFVGRRYAKESKDVASKRNRISNAKADAKRIKDMSIELWQSNIMSERPVLVHLFDPNFEFTAKDQYKFINRRKIGLIRLAARWGVMGPNGYTHPWEVKQKNMPGEIRSIIHRNSSQKKTKV